MSTSGDSRYAIGRTLRDRIEPLVGQVYFSPECHSAYAALGFAPSPAISNGVALPDGPAYFTSRGSLMGQVPGQVVAAAFGVFNPEAVVPSVSFGWSITDATTVCTARHDGAVGQLVRILGERPDGLDRAVELMRRACAPLEPNGKPLFAGAQSQPWPDDAWGQFFVAGDQLREFRGDAHTAVWTAAGLDGPEIGVVSERYSGIPPRTYVRTRAWGTDRLDAAEERLTALGWLEGDGLSEKGQAEREAIEVATDQQMAPALDALGDDFDELIDLITPWGRAVVAAHGYLGGVSDLTG
jgi:Helix-turn-helix family